MTNPANHILTILVDLSHPAFADRGINAQLRLVEVLRGCVRAAVVGSEATLIIGGNEQPVGAYVIAPDDGGEGKQAFQELVNHIRELQVERPEQTVREPGAPATPVVEVEVSEVSEG